MHSRCHNNNHTYRNTMTVTITLTRTLTLWAELHLAIQYPPPVSILSSPLLSYPTLLHPIPHTLSPTLLCISSNTHLIPHIHIHSSRQCTHVHTHNLRALKIQNTDKYPNVNTYIHTYTTHKYVHTYIIHSNKWTHTHVNKHILHTHTHTHAEAHSDD